jgi:hypothetical protein
MVVLENFQVISGSVTKNCSSDLDLISETAKDRYASYTTANHEWINSVESSAYRSALDRIRTSPDILNKMQEQFPGTTITNVTEADEIYWAVSPKAATGSDRSLVDCHYDSPFALFPTGGVIYYRVILACNENKTVTGHEVLLNETGKENPVKLKLENHDLAKNLTPPESSRAARVGNSVTSGFSNPFAGTSWGK